MTTDDEQLLQQLMKTTQLIRRQRHAAFAPQGDGTCEGPRCHEGARHGGRQHGHCHHPARAQHRVLALLAANEGLSQKELAQLMGVRPQSLSELLLRLEESGLVERRRSETDGRVINVYLTDDGREQAQQAAEARRQSARDALGVLTDAEKEELARILEKLAGGLHDA